MQLGLKEEFDIKQAPELKLFVEGDRSSPTSCKGNGGRGGGWFHARGKSLLGSSRLDVGGSNPHGLSVTQAPSSCGSILLSLGATCSFPSAHIQELTTGSMRGRRVPNHSCLSSSGWSSDPGPHTNARGLRNIAQLCV